MSSQQCGMNIHNGGNVKKTIQNIDETILTQQQWQSTTPNYFIPKIGAPTQTTIYVKLQDIKQDPNVDLMPIDLKIKCT
jgi:precorrin-4 methylase